MAAARLEVNVHIVTGSVTSAQNIIKCCNQAGLDVEDIVVTGSRIKKSTFTSIAPLQILNTEISREVGLIDAASILQEKKVFNASEISELMNIIIANVKKDLNVELRI